MRDYNKKIWLGIFAAAAFSCNDKKPEFSINTAKVTVTNAVPSGSGIVYFNDSVYIIGDDAEYIGVMSLSDTGFRKKKLYPDAVLYRIEKAVKHDLESATLGTIGSEKFLFAFGSGGLTPYRDTLFALNMNDGEKSFKRSLLPLYNAVRTKTGLSEKELNIEGAAIAGNRLLLFNRGNNFAILLSWQDFTNYIRDQNSSTLPDFKIIKISLPVINGFPVGISGACALNENEILFTASLEETKDFILDGSIKGSYIGLLQLTGDSGIKLISLNPMNDSAGITLSDKLESIEIIKKQGRSIEAVAVADNDDGESKLFYLRLKIP